jgi:hypothetical protein
MKQVQRRPAHSLPEAIQTIHQALAHARDKQLQLAKPGSLRYKNGLEKALKQANALMLSQPPVCDDANTVDTQITLDFPGEVHLHANPIAK